MKTKIIKGFRINPPETFASFDTWEPAGRGIGPYKRIESLEEAKKAIEQWGTSPNPQYKEYWEKMSKRCTVERYINITYPATINPEINKWPTEFDRIMLRDAFLETPVISGNIFLEPDNT